MDNKAMYKLSYGLFVLTVKDEVKANGCITNTAIQVASDPNTISFAGSNGERIPVSTTRFNASYLL